MSMSNLCWCLCKMYRNLLLPLNRNQLSTENNLLPYGEQPAPANPLPPAILKRRRQRFLTTTGARKRRWDQPAPLALTNYFIVLLDEAEKNNYIANWGRCCIVGTVKSDSPFVIDKRKCFIDLTSVQTLNLTLLDYQHHTPIITPDASLVKLELIYYS